MLRSLVFFLFLEAAADPDIMFYALFFKKSLKNASFVFQACKIDVFSRQAPLSLNSRKAPRRKKLPIYE